MRTTVSIDDGLLDRARRRAAERRLTLGGYVEEALREHLASPKRAAGPVALPVFHGGIARAGIDVTSNRDLYDALDDEDAVRR